MYSVVYRAGSGFTLFQTQPNSLSPGHIIAVEYACTIHTHTAHTYVHEETDLEDVSNALPQRRADGLGLYPKQGTDHPQQKLCNENSMIKGKHVKKLLRSGGSQ